MSSLKTCRFCGNSNYERDHPAAESAWIRYAPRHSAHLKCFVEKKGAAGFRGLPTHVLTGLPFLQIRDLGMEPVLMAELRERGYYRADGLMAELRERGYRADGSPTPPDQKGAK